MKYIFFIGIFLVHLVCKGQVTTGYLNVGIGNCGDIRNATLQVYWNGTLANGTILYTDVAKTVPYDGNWDNHTIRKNSGTGTINAKFFVFDNTGQVGGYEDCGGWVEYLGRDYPASCDSARVAGNDILIRRPLDYDSSWNAGRKYPVMIFLHGNGETGTDLMTMYNAGLPRVLTLSQNVGNPLMDSIIYVMPQHATNASVWRFPNDLLGIVNFIDANYRVDTTRWALGGLSQGAVNTIDVLTWGASSFITPNIYFGKFDRFKLLYVLSSPTLNETDTTFSRIKGRRFRSWIGTSDGFLSQHNYVIDRVEQRGGTGIRYQIPGGHSNSVWDSAMSFRGADTLTNIHRWLINSNGVPSTPPPPTIIKNTIFINRRKIYS
jgi:hypothetical protein